MSSSSSQPSPPVPEDMEEHESNLQSFPPEVFRRILALLTLSDRSKLRRCSRGLRLTVIALDRGLVLRDASAGGSGGGDDPDNADYDNTNAALRRELIDTVEDRRWLSRLQDQPQSEREPTPGPSHLRRVIRGDFLADPINFDSYYTQYASDDDSTSSCRKYKYQRQNRFYESGQLIDDHIWILYNDYWFSFEAFDLNTGKAIENVHCCGTVGPDKDYINDEEERIRLCLECYAGAYGLLAQGLELSVSAERNPHGAWSGPYLTVWEIESGEVRMCVDLYRPTYRIVGLSVVATEKVVVLLAGPDGVELQWHRIPPDTAEMGASDSEPPRPEPDMPGEQPPDHQCSMNCPLFSVCPRSLKPSIWESQKKFWKEQDEGPKQERKWEEWKSDANDKTPVFSYESRRKYPWWPGKRTLIKMNKLRDTPLEGYNTATMQSDSGMLVVVVADEVQIWHVGTMTLVRKCDPFDHPSINVYHGGIYVDNLSVKTTMFPIQDVLGPGEGRYCTRYCTKSNGTNHIERSRRCIGSDRIRRCVGSENHLDLSQCDTDAILARFAHLTYDEQRSFERGDCGLDSNGNSINRSQTMQEGSCSPQLECIVRVVFSMHNKGTSMNYIAHMDINPFYHMRDRESMEWVDEDTLAEYERACLGLGGLFSDGHTIYDDRETGQCMNIFDWERGGIFDFEGGPSDKERQDKCEALLEATASDEERESISKLYNEVEKKVHSFRFPTSLYADAYKLVVCTPFEVAVLPLSMQLLGGKKSIPELWNEYQVDERMYTCPKELKMWHSHRPLDALLVSHWEKVRRRASFDCELLEESNRQHDLKSITGDLTENLGQELALLKAAQCSPNLSCFCFSWRYLAFVSSSFDCISGEGHENLNVYDVVADLVRDGGTTLEAGKGGVKQSAVKQSGIHFELEPLPQTVKRKRIE